VLDLFAANAPDPLDWTQNSNAGVFLTVSILHEICCKTGWTCAINAQVCSTKLCRNFSQWTHLIHSIGSKTHVLGYFGPFHYCTIVVAKLAEHVPLTRKFTKRSCVAIVHNERTRSSPLDPKLMFSAVSDRFVTARKSMQNWLNWRHYRISLLNEVALELFATNAPDPLYWTQN
jgi:hypothetical protein